MANRIPGEDLPDLPHARQLKAGFPWLTFDAELEPEYRQTILDENLRHIRVNLCLGIVVTLAFSAMQATVLGRDLNRIPSLIHMLVMVPVCCSAWRRASPRAAQRLYPPAGAGRVASWWA